MERMNVIARNVNAFVETEILQKNHRERREKHWKRLAH
jgi:hypothetical protein